MPDKNSHAETAQERERNIAEAIHSSEMEGLQISRDAAADAQAYIAGTITSADLVSRARARYGLD